MATSYLEPIPPALLDLLKLLDAKLPNLPLPEADGRSLAEVADVVKDAARVARDLDEAAERAYAALAEHQKDLWKKAARARAYARIYGADDAAFVRALDALDLPVDREAVAAHFAPNPATPAKTSRSAKKKAVATRTAVAVDDAAASRTSA